MDLPIDHLSEAKSDPFTDDKYQAKYDDTKLLEIDWT